MPNYNNGKIYKLVNSFGTTYIGSTTQELCERKAGHASDYRRHLNGRPSNKLSTSIKVFNEDPENVDIVLIELVNCNSKIELHQRERHFIETNICVNKHVPGQTPEDLILTRTNYYQDNKDYILEKSNKYYEDNKEIAKARVNVYRLNNLDIIREKKKLYGIENKEKISKQRSELIICECGSETTKIHVARHKRTKKHIQFVEENIE